MHTPGIVELVRNSRMGTHEFRFQCPACGTRLPKAAVVSRRRAEVEAKVIDRFDGFFFDRATSATVRLAEAAREAGLLVVFEPNTIPRGGFADRAAELSDIVKVSQQPSNRMGTWQPTSGASTKLIIETLGQRGVRFRVRSPRRWGAWRERPAPSQTCIRDTAGAGDWLSAGLIASLLMSADAITFDTVGASIEYGQRLSAISLAFDGPNGALATLGAPQIRQVANDSAPVRVDSLRSEPALPNGNRPPKSSDYCDLCLSVTQR